MCKHRWKAGIVLFIVLLVTLVGLAGNASGGSITFGAPQAAEPQEMIPIPVQLSGENYLRTAAPHAQTIYDYDFALGHDRAQPVLLAFHDEPALTMPAFPRLQYLDYRAPKAAVIGDGLAPLQKTRFEITPEAGTDDGNDSVPICPDGDMGAWLNLEFLPPMCNHPDEEIFSFSWVLGDGVSDGALREFSNRLDVADVRSTRN